MNHHRYFPLLAVLVLVVFPLSGVEHHLDWKPDAAVVEAITGKRARPAPVETPEEQRRQAHVAPTGAPRAGSPPAVARAEPAGDADVDASLRRLRAFELPLAPTTDHPDADENAELLALLEGYAAAGDRLDLGAIEDWLSDQVESRWALALHLNLGLVYRRNGFFSLALEHWGRAWELGRPVSEGDARELAERAAAEYLQLNAWIGRYDQIREILPQLDGHSPTGVARVKLDQVRRAVQVMAQEWSESFKCGPYAIEYIRKRQTGDLHDHPALRDFLTTKQGTSLVQVRDFAADLGMEYQVAKREPGAEWITPSVVHWRLDHYSAFLGYDDGRCEVVDRTMDTHYGRQQWIPEQAMEAEASGYFLVPAGELPEGWTPVPDGEAAQVFGRGNTGNNKDLRACTPCDSTVGGSSDDCGMASYRFSTMLVSLQVSDTPFAYSPPRGPAISFRVVYNEEETNQPQGIPYSNFGPQWTCNWISAVIDDPANQTGTHHIEVYQAGGGSYRYTMQGNVSGREAYGQAILTRTSPDSYRLDHPDGSVIHYTATDPSFAGDKRPVFATQIVTPRGDAVDLGWTLLGGGELRLDTITDAMNETTTLLYAHATDPLKVTGLTGPEGRSVTFTYDAELRLESITDVVNLVSSFGYDGTTDEITSLTTAYGTTTFARGYNASEGDQKWIEATDPNGKTERLEFKQRTGPDQPVPDQVPAAEAPVMEAGDPSLLNNYMSNRNSYYWDKKNYGTYGADYSKAVTYHWLHSETDGTATGRALEAFKAPLRRWVWFGYEGQSSTFDYDLDNFNPILTAMRMEDGSTRFTRATYTADDRLETTTDPLGRTTRYLYHPNGIDLHKVQQSVGGTWVDLVTLTWTAEHQPATVTDAAGEQTTYAYDPTTKQLTGVTNAKNETVSFDYYPDGYYLETVTDPATGTQGFTYDAYGRVRTVTDSSNYTLTFDYDALNRPTRTTYPDTSYEQVVWDRLDPIMVRDRLGRWTDSVYTALGQLAATRNAQGEVTYLHWCRCGDLEGIIDPLGRYTHWTRDIAKRVTHKIYPDGSMVQMRYSGDDGRLLEVEDAMGQITQYGHDLAGAVTSVSYLDQVNPGSTAAVAFEYDADWGRLWKMHDQLGTTTYSYHPIDPLDGILGDGQLASIDSPFDNDLVTFSYDELGRVIGRSIDGVASSVVYDNLGRVDQQTNALGTFDYSYVGTTGRLDLVSLPNGLETAFDYHDVNGDLRLQSIRHQAQGGGDLVAAHTYTYTTDGQIQTWRQQSGADDRTWTYGYDRTNQLLSARALATATGNVVAEHAYAYDAAGNRTTTQNGLSVVSHQHNELNQLLSGSPGGRMRIEGTLDEPGTVSIDGEEAQVRPDMSFVGYAEVAPGENSVSVTALDLNSNQVTKTVQVVNVDGTSSSRTYDLNGNCLSDGMRTYTWDAANRLKTIAMGSHETEFVYDGGGRRVGIIETENGTVTEERWFLWIGATIAEERVDGDGLADLVFSGAGSVVKRFFGGGEVDVVGGGSYLYHRDHLGSVREVSDSTGGTVARYAYSPYGVRRQMSGTYSVRSGFTGHFEHAATGLTLTRFRVYDPQGGVWLTRDPIGEMGGMNLYGYVRNNPIRLVDLLGLCPPGQECSCLGGGDEGGGEDEDSDSGRGGTVGLGAYSGQQMGDAARVRSWYAGQAAQLDPADRAGRTVLKQQAREMTPRSVRAVIESARPSLGPKAGSGGNASRTSSSWNRVGSIFRIGGATLVFGVIATEAVEVVRSDNPCRALTVSGGRVLGGLVGGAGGTVAGSGLPIVGNIGLGVAGAIAGGHAGGELGGELYDETMGIMNGLFE